MPATVPNLIAAFVTAQHTLGVLNPDGLLMRMAACAILVFTVVAGVAVSWVVRKAAIRVGLTDQPDGRRKLHTQTIPLGGGIAIFATSAVTIALLAAASPTLRSAFWFHRPEVSGLFVAAFVVMLVGLIDDSIGLSGVQKLLGQMTAAGAVPVFGASISQIEVFNSTVELGLLSVPFTTLWLVGAINAVNLLDGIDGLATTTGIVVSTAIALMALLTGQSHVALIALIFCGSLLGFLRFNFPPASMFLGDAGSMLIGLTVGMLAIEATVTPPGATLLAASLAMLTIPIFDTAAAILRRKLTGRSVYTADRCHVHHHLLARFGDRGSIVCLGGCSALASAGALLSVWSGNDLIALVGAAAILAVFIAIRAFGHLEFLLVVGCLKNLGRCLLTFRRSDAHRVWQNSVGLQDHRHYELLWTTLVEWAAKLNLCELRIDIDLPSVGEGYHATWRREMLDNRELFWRLDVPLTVGNHGLGLLRITGSRRDSAAENMQQLLDLLRLFETESLPSAGTGIIPEARRPQPTHVRPSSGFQPANAQQM